MKTSLLVVSLLSLVWNVFCEPKASFPLQLSAEVKITAHLIEESSEYPPRYRNMTIHFDYLQRRARADISAGYEAAKTYIRLYHSKNEYMIRDPPINDCKRAYLGELMPFPDIPKSRYVNQFEIDGVLCNHFVVQDFETEIHIYFDTASGAPVRLIHASTSPENEEVTPLLTYDYSNVVLGPSPDGIFELPAPFTHGSCDRHVGGFPYLHVFHHFVKF